MSRSGALSGITKAQYRGLLKEFGSDTSIAEYYGITRQAVSQFKKRIGFEYSEQTKKKRNKRIVNLYDNDMSSSRIAKRFKLSKTHVIRILKDYGSIN